MASAAATTLRGPSLAGPDRRVRAARPGRSVGHVFPRPRASAPDSKASIGSSGSTVRTHAASSARAAAIAPMEHPAPSGPYCTLPSSGEMQRRLPLVRRLLCYAGIACPVGYELEAPRQWAGRGRDDESVSVSGLPADLESIAYFTDGPGSEVEAASANGPLSWWRYQGPGL